jgi:hypothetical protein
MNLAVPLNFSMHGCFEVRKVWERWHFGEPVNRIRPFKKFERVDVIGRINKKAYSMMKGVMANMPTEFESDQFTP